MLFRRRRIGAAYERSPADRIGDWARRNILVLTGASVGFVFWLWVVNRGVSILNTITGEGSSAGIAYDDGSPLFVSVKIVGGIVLSLVIIKSQTK